MIAEDHELLGLLATADHADDAAHRLDALIVRDVHLERHRAGPDAVGDRHPALPVVRCDWSAHVLQDGDGIALVERHRRDARQLLVAHRAFGPAAVRLLLPVERERLALAEPVVEDRAPLDVRIRAPGAVRVHRAQARAVLGGIRVDDRARGAAPLGLVHLVAAVRIGVRVPHQHDLALQVDAHAVEELEVLGAAAVRVHDLGAHLSRGRIAVVRHLRRVVVELRVLVGRVGVFGEVEHLVDRLPDGERRGLREAEQRRELVVADLVQAVFAETVAHVLGDRVVPRRARQVRLFGQEQQVLAVGLAGRRCREDPLHLVAQCGCNRGE